MEGEAKSRSKICTVQHTAKNGDLASEEMSSEQYRASRVECEVQAEYGAGGLSNGCRSGRGCNNNRDIWCGVLCVVWCVWCVCGI